MFFTYKFVSTLRAGLARFSCLSVNAVYVCACVCWLNQNNNFSLLQDLLSQFSTASAAPVMSE